MPVSLQSYLRDWHGHSQPAESPEVVPPERFPGYYIHQGYVYLTGSITNMPPEALRRSVTGTYDLGSSVPAWGEVTPTIFEDLPAEICPRKIQRLVLPIDPRWTCDPGTKDLERPVQFHATIHPNGTLTLDENIPIEFNRSPSFQFDPMTELLVPTKLWYAIYTEAKGEEEFPQYPNPLYVTIVLGNARWPLAGGADTYTTKNVINWLDGHWRSPSLSGVAHGSRVHLRGHAEYVPGKLGFASETVPLLYGPPRLLRAFESSLEDLSTAVLTAGEIAPLLVDEFGVQALSDQPNKGVLDPPLSPVSPVPGRAYGDGGVGGVVQEFPGGKHTIGALRNVRPALRPAGGPEEPEVGGNVQAKQELGTSGLAYECTYGGGLIRVVSVTCHGPKKYPDLTFQLGSILAGIHPQPPWFTVTLDIEATGGAAIAGPGGGPEHAYTGCRPFHFPEGIGCGDPIVASPWFVVHGAQPEPGEPGISIAERKGESEEEVEDIAWRGFLLPEGNGPEYHGVARSGEEALPRDQQLASVLWNELQAVDITITPLTEVGNDGRIAGTVMIQPYYEMRQFGALPGESLDFTLTGWPSAGGEVGIGPGARAIIPKPS